MLFNKLTRIRKEQLPESLRALKLHDLAQYLVVWACRRLSKDGTLAIVMGLNALNRTSLVEAINAQGCRIRASLHVPAGTRSNTAIASQVLVVQRGAQEAIFVGQLSDDDRHQRRLLQNFKRHKSDRHPSLGRVCELERFISYEALEAEHRLREQVRATNLVAHRFSDLLTEKSRHRRDVDASEAYSIPFAALFLPQGGSRFYADPTEMPERVTSYTRFELDPDRAHAQYLLRWLETDLGHTALRVAGASSVTGLARTDSPVLERLTCYLPPVHEQQEVLEALRQLERVRAEVQEIENSCWMGNYSGEEVLHRAQTINQEDRYEDWIESLPYPLASILWRHKVSGEDPRIQYRILLDFFEALAEFLATIHLSAFISHEPTWRAHQERLLATLNRQNLTFERATFGAWKAVVESLSASARKMLEDKERVDRHRGQVKQVILPKPEPVDKPAAAALPAKSVNRSRRSLEEKRTRAQAERQARYDTIRERYAKGEYLKTIATDLGITYRTARKYALSEECPTRKPMPKRPRMLEPYEPYLKARWAEGCKNGKQLYREIVAHGFPGSRTPVAAFVAQLRREENEGKTQSLPTAGEPLTPRKASRLVLRNPERLTDADRMALAQLQDVHSGVGTTLAFTERFTRIVRDRRGGAELEQWLVDAEASEVREIRQFAHKVRQDEAAVRASCTLKWSNGQTEGKITKLKAIKRQMYGRAKFDLLRRRALYAA